MCIYIYIYIYTYINTHTHTYIYIYTYIYWTYKNIEKLVKDTITMKNESIDFIMMRWKYACEKRKKEDILEHVMKFVKIIIRGN